MPPKAKADEILLNVTHSLTWLKTFLDLKKKTKNHKLIVGWSCLNLLTLDQLHSPRESHRLAPGASQAVPAVRKLPASAGDVRGKENLLPGSGGVSGGGHGSPLQCSCLENPRDRKVWWATVHRVAKSWTWLMWLGTHAGTTWFLRGAQRASG